jgi:hypothetical protein
VASAVVAASKVKPSVVCYLAPTVSNIAN